MKWMLSVVAALLLLMNIAVADVGPGPEPIDVTVQVVGIGVDEFITLEYFCSEPEYHDYDEGIMGERKVNLTCSGGTCTNEHWFYKLNPCFYSNGTFVLKIPHETFTSPEVSLESGGQYHFEFDTETGEFKRLGYEPYNSVSNPCCGAIYLLTLLPVLAFVRARM